MRQRIVKEMGSLLGLNCMHCLKYLQVFVEIVTLWIVCADPLWRLCRSQWPPKVRSWDANRRLIGRKRFHSEVNLKKRASECTLFFFEEALGQRLVKDFYQAQCQVAWQVWVLALSTQTLGKFTVDQSHAVTFTLFHSIWDSTAWSLYPPKSCAPKMRVQYQPLSLCCEFGWPDSWDLRTLVVLAPGPVGIVELVHLCRRQSPFPSCCDLVRQGHLEGPAGGGWVAIGNWSENWQVRWWATPSTSQWWWCARHHAKQRKPSSDLVDEMKQSG